MDCRDITILFAQQQPCTKRSKTRAMLYEPSPHNFIFLAHQHILLALQQLYTLMQSQFFIFENNFQILILNTKSTQMFFIHWFFLIQNHYSLLRLKYYHVLYVKYSHMSLFYPRLNFCLSHVMWSTGLVRYLWLTPCAF